MKKRKKLNPQQGERLKECLEAKKMSQKELAEKSGYSPQYINYIVNKKKNMSLESASAFAKELNVCAEYLLCETNYKNHYDKFLAFMDELSVLDEKSLQAEDLVMALLKLHGISIEFFTAKYDNKRYEVFEEAEDSIFEADIIFDESDDEFDKKLEYALTNIEKYGKILVCKERKLASVKLKDQPIMIFRAEEIYKLVRDIVTFVEFQAERLTNEMKVVGYFRQ